MWSLTMSKSVYIETTIPSAYYDEREDVVSRFHRHQTQLWWKAHRMPYDLYTSEAVLAELHRGEFAGRDEAVRLLEGIPVLTLTEDIRGVARVYRDHLVMPGGDMGDSFHLAFACVNELDYLLTWNCRHLANPSKIAHITTINRRLGLLTPTLLTPEMLVEEVTDEPEQ
jgi:predicted nucleic acid-binding protein